MNGKKGFIFKTGILLLLIAAVLVMVGFFLYQMASKTAIGNLSDTQRFTTTSSATIVDNCIYSNINGANIANGLNQFSAKGTMKGSAQSTLELTLTRVSGGALDYATTTKTNVLNAGVKNGLLSNAVNLYTQEEVGAGILDADTKYIWYVSAIVGEEFGYNVYVQTQAQLLAQVERGSNEGAFTFYVIARENKVFLTSDSVLMALNDNWRDLMHLSLGQSIDEEVLADNKAQVLKASVGSKNYLVGLTALEATLGSASYYYIGFTDYSKVDTVLTEYTYDIAIILGFCVLLVAICCCGYGILIFRGRRKFVRRDNVIRIGGAENYQLTVDKSGIITESDLNYDRYFSARNLSEGVAYNAFHEAMKIGDAFMTTLMDHKGAKHLFNVTVTAVLPKQKGFKVFAGDVSDLSGAVAKAMAIELTQEESDSMAQSYAKLIWSHKKLLVGRIHITNLTNLQVMFGKQFSDNVFAEVVEKVSKRFDMVYPSRVDDSIGVMTYEAADLTARADELKADMNEMNKPVNVDSNLVTVGCEGGFDMVERGVGESSYDYVNICIRAAMKRAADDPDRSYYLYHDFQKKHFIKYMDKEYDIKQMLEDDSFEMHFQPQYSVKEKRVAGFESLFRFRKTLNIEMSTFEFIRYAERTGNMIILGNFIFETSMKFAKSLEGRDVAVSLNVSPVQLMQVGFTENLLRLYRQYELKPGSVCVEITESFLMTTMEETLLKLDLLIKEGIKVHLDDFGTLYSSLLYLKKLPISAIKIDMEFIKDLCTDEYSRNITQLVINISKQLGVESIAEGVETEEQKTLLAKMGCDVLQGFLIGKAMTQQEALKLL